MGVTYFFKIYSQTIKLVDTSYSEKDNETCYDWRHQKSRQTIGGSGDQFPYSAGYGTRWDHLKNIYAIFSFSNSDYFYSKDDYLSICLVDIRIVLVKQKLLLL
jgi:hypothetical protein